MSAKQEQAAAEVTASQLDVFTARELRNRSGELLRGAGEGRLSLITKHGRPAILAIPFGKRLLDEGLHRTMAVSLFESDLVTLAQGARLANLSLEAFIEMLGELDIPAVDYPAEDLSAELELAR